MACTNARREAFEAGGQAVPLSLESRQCRRLRRRHIGGSTGDATTGEASLGRAGSWESSHSHGMVLQETGEISHCPHSRARTRITGRIKRSGPSRSMWGPQANQQAKGRTGWRINWPTDSVRCGKVPSLGDISNSHIRG